MMDYSNKIRRELMNDKAFQSLYASVKPEEKQKVDEAVEAMLKLANDAAVGFTIRFNNSEITPEEVEAAISDRTGRK